MSFISLGIMAMSASAGIVRRRKTTSTTRTTVKSTTKAHKTAKVQPVKGTIIIGPPVRIFRKKTTKPKAPPTLKTNPTKPTKSTKAVPVLDDALVSSLNIHNILNPCILFS